MPGAVQKPHEDPTASRPAAPEIVGLANHAAIERVQLRKLKDLLREIHPANSFYSGKLAAPGVDLQISTIEDFCRQIPFTTRHELVRDRLENPPYGTDLTYPLERYVRCHQTSGTTTVPIRWLDTKETWDHIVENWIQILGVAGVKPRDRFFFAFSFGPFLGFWSAVDAVIRLGCFCFPGGAMSSVARIQAILDNRITILCCTPTYAQHLGEVAREKNIDVSTSCVRLIIVAGEGGGSVPATRARIEKLWPGATVFDHHGMTEVGPVSYQCPQQPGILHVLESAYLAEVVSPETGAPVGAGETGELVLTTLDRIGSPLLRYRTGDLVRRHQSVDCPCGYHGVTLAGGILGRSDDMVIVRGVNVYPSLIEEIVRAHPEVTEYRVEFDCRGALTDIALEFETHSEGPSSLALQKQLQQAFQTALNLRVAVRVLPRGSLPRFEMKAQRWVRISSQP
jgi:phenylacetate-CoA ligase